MTKAVLYIQYSNTQLGAFKPTTLQPLCQPFRRHLFIGHRARLCWQRALFCVAREQALEFSANEDISRVLRRSAGT